MIETLQDFVDSLPLLLQWVGVMLVGAIPFAESELAAVIGIIAGVVPPIAIAAGIIGNFLAVAILVIATSAVRRRATRSSATVESPRRLKVRRAFDKYGVAGVSLLGPLILPSHITSVAMVTFGASRRAVLIWQAVAISLWGILFGVLAAAGVNLVANR